MKRGKSIAEVDEISFETMKIQDVHDMTQLNERGGHAIINLFRQ